MKTGRVILLAWWFVAITGNTYGLTSSATHGPFASEKDCDGWREIIAGKFSEMARECCGGFGGFRFRAMTPAEKRKLEGFPYYVFSCWSTP